MGIFSKKTCSFCGSTARINIKQLKDGYICFSCTAQAGHNVNTLTNNKSVSDIRADIESFKSTINKIENFTSTAEVENYFQINSETKEWLVPIKGLYKEGTVDYTVNKDGNPLIGKFENIINYELLEDGESIVSGSLGRAIAGGVLLGGVGAVVGAVTGSKKTKAICSSLKIKLTLANSSESTVYINFIVKETKKTDFVYKTEYSKAQEVLSLLDIATSTNKSEVVVESKSNLDQLKELKELLDLEIITKEEFELKKKAILNI